MLMATPFVMTPIPDRLCRAPQTVHCHYEHASRKDNHHEDVIPSAGISSELPNYGAHLPTIFYLTAYTAPNYGAHLPTISPL
jgi:hypothetical protein